MHVIYLEWSCHLLVHYVSNPYDRAFTNDHWYVCVCVCKCVAWVVRLSTKTTESKPIEIKHNINSKLMFIKMQEHFRLTTLRTTGFHALLPASDAEKNPRITWMHGPGECEFNKQMSYNLMTNGFDSQNDRNCYIEQYLWQNEMQCCQM